MKLAEFSVLTFDCYGTLIDWEHGILAALAPLRARVDRALADDTILETFARIESRQQAMTPAMPYSDLLAKVHGQLAAAWGTAPDAAEAAQFGDSIGDWLAFPDTANALVYLKQHYRLVILSNVDRAGFKATQRQLGVVPDAVYTAQDIGSYKPNPRNFAYLIQRLAADGVPRGQVLHVAQSLFHDHVPAQAAGLASAWIDRRHDAEGSGATLPVPADVRYDFRFVSMADLVEAHRAGR